MSKVIVSWQSELEHRSVKRAYARTNKIHHARHIARIHRRERLMKRVLLQAEYTKIGRKRKRGSNSTSTQVKIDPAKGHHHISLSRNYPTRVLRWVAEHEEDHAFDVSSMYNYCPLYLIPRYSSEFHV